MSDCTTCAERQGYYLDAETIRNQQEHIAELERDRDHWRELFCEQAGDTLTLDRENAELKSLVRDMLFAIRLGSMSDLTDRSVLASWFNDFSGRASELRLLEGDAE